MDRAKRQWRAFYNIARLECSESALTYATEHGYSNRQAMYECVLNIYWTLDALERRARLHRNYPGANKADLYRASV